MFFDGVEYRETIVYRFIYPRSRGWRLTHSKDASSDEYHCHYNSDKLVNKSGDEAYLTIDISIPTNVFESRNVFSSSDEEAYLYSISWISGLTFSTGGSTFYGEIISWKMKVNVDKVIYSDDYLLEGFIFDEFSGRYEYEMTVLDSLGISHQVTGWADYLDNNYLDK